MPTVNRRDLLKALLSAPAAAAALTWTDADVAAAAEATQAAQKTAQRTGTRFTPKFFTAHEFATVGVLVDLIIPKDARSGGATDAGVPQFMDFMMIDQPARQNAMRGGLAWLDDEMRRRMEKTFITATDAERRAMLDDISWPQRVRPGMSHGVTFFNSFRDLTASGFFTSKIGMADLGFMGNEFNPDWAGCPDAALKKLGL